jgi:hypothetical protein
VNAFHHRRGFAAPTLTHEESSRTKCESISCETAEMRLVWQWITLERELPATWTDARLALTVHERDADRAAALLGGANPLRRGNVLRLFVSRTGGFGPEALRRALLRLDRQGIGGTLEVAGVTEAAEAPAPTQATLAAQWDEATATLPADWSDLHAELELRSSDHLERAALLTAPMNPTRVGSALALRFRVAHRFGYGVSARMARRCLERLDEERIRGEVRVLRVLCDTDAVGTQGPVWRVDGKAV